MERTTKKVILIISSIVVITILVFAYLLGLFGFLNRPLNNLIAGTPEKSCSIDSDCIVKLTKCADCNEGYEAVNKNWREFCPFPNIASLCKMRIPGEAKCINQTCQEIKSSEEGNY